MKREPLTVIQVQRRNTIDGRAHNPGLLGWRALAYCPAADAPAELERQRARFGHHEPTLEFRSRTANGAQPHAHIPPQTVALGCALDLTTQFRDVLTNWDFEVKGWRMVCAPDAMEQSPGRAVLYLLRTDTREQNAHDYERFPIVGGMNYSDALAELWGELSARNARAMLDAIEAGDPHEVAALRDRVDPHAHHSTHRLYAAWQAVIAKAQQNEPRETNGATTPREGAVLPEHAAELYERWHEREAEHVTDVDGLPDLIGIYVGRAMRIGYSSDKWHARGKTIDYEHDFSERGHIAPECWADTADLADARALAIVGGTMRITEDGID